MTSLDWYVIREDSKATLSDIVNDILVKMNIFAVNELVRLVGSAEAIEVLRPHFKHGMKHLVREAEQRLNIKGMDPMPYSPPSFLVKQALSRSLIYMEKSEKGAQSEWLMIVHIRTAHLSIASCSHTSALSQSPKPSIPSMNAYLHITNLMEIPTVDWSSRRKQIR